MSRPVQQAAGMDVATSRLPDHSIPSIDHVKQLVRIVHWHLESVSNPYVLLGSGPQVNSAVLPIQK